MALGLSLALGLRLSALGRAAGDQLRRNAYRRACGAACEPENARAVCTEGAIESSWTAGYDGRPTTTLTEYSEEGSREVDLPARDAYAAVIDHVIACCQGRDGCRLSPASVLDTLQLTLDVRTALTAAKRP